MMVAMLAASPALAQTRPAAVDNCKPIGRTEDGKLVYSMKCDPLPAPAPRAAMAAPTAPQAAPESPAPEVEEDKGGMFGLRARSFIRPTNDAQRPAGIGPSVPR
jgi:hypothetical protein